MTIRIPEKNKIPGVSYAVSDDGIELPVVDITHPAFMFEVTAAELTALEEKTLKQLHTSSKLPGFLLRYLSKRSIVMRGTLQAAGGYLSGMATYLQKIGPDNIGRGYSGRIDRRMLSSIAPVSGRIRLRNMARLIADGLASVLAGNASRPLHLFNIGGGPAIDSLNALILIRKEHPQWLDGRRVVIHVLDLDKAGPNFGARALAAVTSDGGPLAGLDVSFDHIRYDWRNPAALANLIAGWKADDAVIVGSSEGGLFEYGTDDDILANLSVIHNSAPAETVLVGSIIREGQLAREINELSRMTIQIRRLDEFKALVARIGWTVDRATDDNPLYHVVSLKRM